MAEPSAPECCGWLQAADHTEQAEQRVFESIELAQRKFHIEPRRVFLAGFDGGGTMALRLAMSHPGQFAGVISLCGPFPTGGTPLGNLIAARRLGMFLATGRGSMEYPADQVCEDLRLLHTAGLVGDLAAVSLRPRAAAADASRHQPLDHGADQPSPHL